MYSVGFLRYIDCSKPNLIKKLDEFERVFERIACNIITKVPASNKQYLWWWEIIEGIEDRITLLEYLIEEVS